MRARTTEDLGNLVRQRRKELGLSQASLAESAGVTRQWLVRFEQGRSDVTLQNSLAVINALDLDLSLDVRGRRDPAPTPRRTPSAVVTPSAPSDHMRHEQALVERLGTEKYRTVLHRVDTATDVQGRSE